MYTAYTPDSVNSIRSSEIGPAAELHSSIIRHSAGETNQISQYYMALSTDKPIKFLLLFLLSLRTPNNVIDGKHQMENSLSK